MSVAKFTWKQGDVVWPKFTWKPDDVVWLSEEKGGAGSGHHGHGGRPGKRGGSASGTGGAGTPTFSEEANIAAARFAPTIDEATKQMRKEGKDWSERAGYINASERAELLGADTLMVRRLDIVWNQQTHSLAQSRLQKLAADEFGADFPDWQKKQLASFETERKRLLDAGEELTYKYKTPAEQAWDHVERLKESNMFPTQVNHLNSPSDLFGKHGSGEDVTRSYLKLARSETQKNLAEAGITEISVYRGVRTDKPLGKAGAHVKITTQAALVSWTPDLKTSEYFGKLKKTEQGVRLPKSGTILKMTIPASRVVSVGWSGFGLVAEKEFVVLGGAGDVAAIHSTH